MEFVGTLQFFNRNGKRGNPTALYLERTDNGECRISIRLPQWRELVGVGATPGKAAGDFEVKLKLAHPMPGSYDGPAWQGIKAEKPTPAKPASPPVVPKAESSAEPTLGVGSSPVTDSLPAPNSPSAQAPGVPTEDGSTNPA